MLDPNFFEGLAKKLTDAVPSGLKEIKDEVERNMKAILQSTFTKLDLVTREEFDLQVAVLARTRAKLDAMEKRVRELENSFTSSPQKAKKTPKNMQSE